MFVYGYTASGEAGLIARLSAERCPFCNWWFTATAFCGCAVGRRLLLLHQRWLAGELNEGTDPIRHLTFWRYLVEHGRLLDDTTPDPALAIVPPALPEAEPPHVPTYPWLTQ